jgi:leader peptidase (prepilin peptidase) / N-methyltransferase
MPELAMLAPLGYLLAVGIPLALIDIREHRLPNRLTISSILITFVGLLAAAFFSGDWGRSLLALAIGLLTFLIGWFLAAKSLIGMGDIKLLVSLNSIGGYFSILLPLVLMTGGFVLASAVSAIRIFRRRLDLNSSIALGPYLLLGFYLSVYPVALSVTAEAWS